MGQLDSSRLGMQVLEDSGWHEDTNSHQEPVVEIAPRSTDHLSHSWAVCGDHRALDGRDLRA